MNLRAITSVWLLAGVLLAGCGDGARDEAASRPVERAPADMDELPPMPGAAPETVMQVPEQNRWRLQWLAGLALPDTEAPPTLELDATTGQAGGLAGVNRFSGRYELDSRRLSFGELASTRMAGPDELMALEQAYLEALERTDGWRRADGGLELMAGEEVIARLVPAGD